MGFGPWNPLQCFLPHWAVCWGPSGADNNRLHMKYSPWLGHSSKRSMCSQQFSGLMRIWKTAPPLAGIQNKIERSFRYWMVPVRCLWHAMLMALSCLSLSQSKFQPNEMRAHPESWIRGETGVAYFICLLNLRERAMLEGAQVGVQMFERHFRWICSCIMLGRWCEHLSVSELCLHVSNSADKHKLVFIKGTFCMAELMQTRKFRCWLRALNNAWLTDNHSLI